LTNEQSSSAVDPARFFQTVVAGIVSGFLAIMLAVGFANLVLPAELRGYTPVLIGMGLLTTAILNAFGSITGTMPRTVSVMQDVPVVVLAGTASVVTGAMAGRAIEADIVTTIVVACLVSTVLSGVVMFLLGTFRLGRLVRYVPYTVTGGFLAGTGWLIFFGGLTIIVEVPMTFAAFLDFDPTAHAGQLALAGAVIVLVVVLSRRANGTLLIPIAMFALILAFNAVVQIMGIGQAALREAGWLVPLPPDGHLWPPVSPDALTRVDWHAVAASLVTFPGLIAIMVLALLMNATGIELERGHDADLDAELRSVGIRNVLAGFAGGLPGYLSVSLSLVAERLGADRFVGLVVAVLCVAALAFGDIVLGLMPTPLLGGLLVWIGASLMIEWVIKSRRRLPLAEYLIIPLILVVIVAAGFTWGVFAGLVAAVALFVVQNSRLNVVHDAFRGSSFQSHVEVTPEQRAELARLSEAILVLRLHGYLFFGTAEALRQRVLMAVRDTGAGPPIKFVVIDFRRVTGVDSSAVVALARLGQVAQREGFAVVLSDLPAHARADLEKHASGTASLRFADRVEDALAACETELLPPVVEACTPLSPLAAFMGSEPMAQRIAHFGERSAFAAGTRLIEEGEAGAALLLVESGRVAVSVAGRDGRARNLAQLGPGAVVGELAFYVPMPRAATVTAHSDTTVWQVTQASLQRMRAEEPDAAAAFHARVATILAERLARADRMLTLLGD